MYDLIHRIAQWVALLLGPGTGIHRAGARRPHRPDPRAPRPAGIPLPRSPYCVHQPLDGAASRLVRPYLAAHEQELDRQRHRRLALVLAADFGIDLDQHIVGARKAAA
ncbi:hypothetical protein [Streptomyces sp. AC512_CC834]|uniref:hypothetical protein n=1 Tax=Streptomyces sp. AC512_CC834 TaxID=2823691 RepID=UPI001C26D936|nr:hypothetical protein [Streptomyces sp. AC512_CC834]